MMSTIGDGETLDASLWKRSYSEAATGGLAGLDPRFHRSLTSFCLGVEVTFYTDLDCRKNISESPENTGHPAEREPGYQGLCRHHLMQFDRNRIRIRFQRGTHVARHRRQS